MKYIIITTHTTEDGGSVTTTTHHEANTIAEVHEAYSAHHEQGDNVRVYADPTTEDGLMLAAFNVAYKSARKSTERGGTATQWTIRNDLASIASGLRYVAGLVNEGEYLSDMLPTMGQDAQAFVSEAAMGIMDGWRVQRGKNAGKLRRGMVHGGTVEEVHRAGYARLNAYIYGMRSASEKEVSTEYIIDGGGDIVALKAGIGQILNGGDKWIPTSGGNMDTETAARLGGVLTAAAATLSTTQRNVWALIAAGYSTRQAAAKLRRKHGTIDAHVALIRAKVADYIRDNAPEFTELIRDAEVKAAAMAAHNLGANERRTDGGKASKSAKNAEYCRAYRARKKAAKEAAAKDA